MRIIKKDIISNIKIFSIFFVLLAIPFAQLIRVYFNTWINISDIVLFLSVLLLVIVCRNKVFTPSFNKKSLALFLYLLFLTFISFFSNIDSNTSGGCIYNLYAVVFLYVLAIGGKDFDKNSFLKIVFYMSGILNLFSLYIFTSGFSDFSNRVHVFYATSGDVLADRVSLSILPIICILACLTYTCNSKKTIIIKCFFILISLTNLLIFQRRGRLATLILQILLFIYYHYKPQRKIKYISFIKIAIVLLSCIFIIFYLVTKTAFFEDLVNLWQSFLNALETLLFGGNDASAGVRFGIRKELSHEIRQFSFIEFLFGKGYMYKYLDFPLLQAFVDLGLIGGLIFCYFNVIYPFYTIFKQRPPLTGYNEFINYLLIMGIADLFYYGIPYGWNKYIYIILSMMTENRILENEKKFFIKYCKS